MERLRGLLFGAMIGDAFALPAHWQYDTGVLESQFKDYDHYIPVLNHPYHGDKHIGGQTHYGDQALLMLRSIASNEGFNLNAYRAHWCHMMAKYQGYMDKASKESLILLESGSKTGSNSDDLAGFTICAPLITYHFDDEKLFEYLDGAVKLTHDSISLVKTSHFLTYALLELIIGKSLEDAFAVACEKVPDQRQWLDRIERYSEFDATTIVKNFGQSCSFNFALPSALSIALKYKDDFLGAMRANVLAGGDSAARGMLIGMVLGTYLGYPQLPDDLKTHLGHRDLLLLYTKHHRV